MDENSVKVLEFDKILDLLSGFAQTKTGKELCIKLTPQCDQTAILSLLSETSQAKQFLNSCGNLRFLDTHPLIRHVEMAVIHSVLQGEDLFEIANHLHNLNQIKESIRGQKESLPSIWKYASQINNFQELENAIFQKIEPSGELKPNATAELAAINRNIQEVRSRIYEKLTEILNSGNYGKMFQESIVTIRSMRYVIPLKAEHKTHFPCIVHDQSVSGETLFVEPLAITPLNNDYKILLSKQKREIEKILLELTELVNGRARDILSSLDAEVMLDVIFAKAELSLSWKASEPILIDKPAIKVTGARHPLISNEKVIPISFEIGNRFNTLIITGPNTGGKTVTLKTAGLFVLMTYCGIHIPADSNSEIGMFSDLLADIGEEQSIEQNLSSFSAHLSTIVHILQFASNQTLVLLDELGAGTDPDEGAALGMSIISLLHRNEIPLMVSTHLSLIKSFAYRFPNAENACVGFDLETLQPTYKLMIGVPGQSHAFHISKFLGLNEEIIETAERYLSRSDIDSKKLIEGLEKKTEEIETNLSVSEDIRVQMEERQSMHERDLEAIKEKNLKIKENLTGKFTREMNKILSDLRNLLAEINRGEISGHQKELIKKQVEEINQEFEDKIKEVELELPTPKMKYCDTSDLKCFDTVFIPQMKQEGIIIKLNPEPQTMEVQYRNGIRQTLSYTDVRKIEAEAVETEVTLDFAIKNRLVDQKIDVHGLRVEEAIPLIDKFLDDAYLARLSQVYILHGVGGGILREEVKKHLKNHPHVDSWDSSKDHATVTLKNESFRTPKRH